MTDHEDNPPNTPPPRPSMKLPSIPPPPPVPGEFGKVAAETKPTEQAPQGQTLTDADIAAITVAFETTMDGRTQIYVDALKAAGAEVRAARAEMQSVANWATSEARSNLAQISELAGIVQKLAHVAGVTLQHTTIIRKSVAPHAEESITAKAGADVGTSTSKTHVERDGLRATATIELLPVPDEEEPTDPGRR